MADSALTAEQIAYKDADLVSHQLPNGGKFVGSLAILTILLTMIIGPVLPIICLGLFVSGWIITATALTATIIASMVFAQHSSRWCRFYLRAAGFFGEKMR